MTTKPQSIPEGYGTITPSLTFKDCRKALEFYKKAFSAEVRDLFPRPDDKGTMHATIKIGNSILMMGDEMQGAGCKSAETLGSSPITLFVYVPNVDTTFKQAISAGATETMPVAEMFWGDRSGSLKDPFGYSWMIATHTRDLTKEEVQQGAKAFFDQMKKQA